MVGLLFADVDAFGGGGGVIEHRIAGEVVVQNNVGAGEEFAALDRQ
jgi:hypothetical protein